MYTFLVVTSVDDEIADWQKNRPMEFSILCNAFSEGWIREAIGKCIGATVQTKYHPLGWKLCQAIEQNLEEVLWLVRFLELFGSDEKIGAIIDQLKNREEYNTAFSHLMTAYQFHRAGWNVQLEYDNRPKCVDLMVTKGGEVAYIEHSQKMLPLMPPFEFPVMSGVLNRLIPPFFKSRLKIIYTGDGGTEEEIVRLIKQNAKAISSNQNSIVMKSDNFRIEIEREKVEKIEDSEAYTTTHDERGVHLPDRLLKKIRVEHEQTKSKIAQRVVVLQVLGPPAPEKWDGILQEVHKRLCGLPSKPDAVLLFMKKWYTDGLHWDIVGYLTTTERGRIFDETSAFLESNEKLE